MQYPLLIWGGSGHSKMLRNAISASGRSVVAVAERNREMVLPFEGVERLNSEDQALAWAGEHSDAEFVIAIGGHNGIERIRLHVLLSSIGLKPFSPLDPHSYIASTAKIGAGSHVMPMVAICEDVVIGRQCIINTNASVDHECILGDGVHIMPGVTVAGCVTIEDNVTIGSNATIFPRVRIGAGSQIGAGSVVTQDVAPGTVVIGAPARQYVR